MCQNKQLYFKERQLFEDKFSRQGKRGILNISCLYVHSHKKQIFLYELTW